MAKWKVTYQKANGTKFVRLFPEHYGKTPEAVRKATNGVGVKRSVGRNAGMSISDAERMRVVKVERSKY